VIENQIYQRWKLLTIDLHYVKAFFNPYLLGEHFLLDDVDAKEALNKVLWATICTSTAHALAIKDFADFVESQSPFSNTPQ
jgi:hypothetical protein